MFSIGMPEMILICALALVVVGPDKLPDFARTVAKWVIDIKKTATGLKDSLTEELSPAIDELKPELQDATRALNESLKEQKKLTIESQPEQPQGEEEKTEEAPDDQAGVKPAEEPTDTAAGSFPSMTTDELIERARKIKDNNPEDRDA